MRVNLQFQALLLAALLTAGCALHRPAEIAPPAEMPASFAPAPEPGRAVPERWWLAFGDPQLDSLMQEAFAQNLDLARAVARLQQAEAASRATDAARYPFVNLEGQGRREKTPGLLGETTGNSYRLSLAAGFEIDLWQKLKNRSQAAELEGLATERDVQTLLLSLSGQLADLYYLVAEQRAQLELTDQTIASFADTLERVGRRYREGLVPALDVYQARQNLAAAQARRPQFEAAFEQARHALAVLLGRYPGQQKGETPPLAGVPAALPAGLPSEVLARRPDVEAALQRVRAGDARVAAAIAERFPSFNLAGGYGRSRTAFSTGDITGGFWNLILNLAQPVFDAGRRKAEVERSEAAFRESLAAYHQAVLRAFQEVEDALSANRTSEDRISRLEEQVAATEASLRLSLDRYLTGLSDYLPVLTAQAAQFTAQSQLIAARRQLISDRISLARALGGSWMEDELERRLVQQLEKGSQL